jgi:hypothetical protein
MFHHNFGWNHWIMWWTNSRPPDCAAGSRAKDARIIRVKLPRPVSLGLRLGTKNWENPRFYQVLPYRFYHETSGFQFQRSLYPWENHFHKMTLGSLTRSGWSWNTWSAVVDESGWRQWKILLWFGAQVMGHSGMPCVPWVASLNWIAMIHFMSIRLLHFSMAQW